jgi:hypothetical protein
MKSPKLRLDHHLRPPAVLPGDPAIILSGKDRG